jgi:hypothetical protein
MTQKLQIRKKDTIVNGQPAQVEYVEIDGQIYTLSRGAFTVLSLEDEWYEDVRDPQTVVETLKSQTGFKPDLFTFWQRYPDTGPRYQFPQECEEIAVLRIQSFDHWWNHQIKSRVRNLIRKTEKEGVEVRETSFDDDFVRGMTAIFNESPIRQGRRFWHYGKDFATIQQQFSRFIFREDMIGAYYQNELIGFVMLGNAGRYAVTGQIISSLKHRDKATTNALVAKAVEVCEKKGLPALIYLNWSDDTLAEFKRRCGFERTALPRYFVPLTAKGKLSVKLGAHRGLKEMLPKKLRNQLKPVRRFWHELREGRSSE